MTGRVAAARRSEHDIQNFFIKCICCYCVEIICRQCYNVKNELDFTYHGKKAHNPHSYEIWYFDSTKKTEENRKRQMLFLKSSNRNIL